MLYVPAQPKLISVAELKKDYQVISRQMVSKGPVILRQPNLPDLVLLSQDSYSQLRHEAKAWEEQMLEQALLAYNLQRKKKKLLKLVSFSKLTKEPHAH